MSNNAGCGRPRSNVKTILGRIYNMLSTMDHLNIAVVVISIIPMLAVVIAILTKKEEMGGDGLTTANEMLESIIQAMEYCEKEIEEFPAPLDENKQPYSVYCPGEWDQLICWPSSPPGVHVRKKCPSYIVDFNHDEYAVRTCEDNGHWLTYPDNNKTWGNYDKCLPNTIGDQSEIIKGIKMGGTDPQLQSMTTLYTVGYSFSLVALTFAMIILAYFQRLHCTRNYIHMHLFASFMLRAIVIFVKDKVVFLGSGIMDVQNQASNEDLSLFEMRGNILNENKVGCRIIITLFHYFLATNYYWILVEALYLHSLIFVAFFSDKKYLFRFTLTGWGVPILFVAPWAIVRATLKNEACWDIPVPEYAWIYNGPIVVANVINFLLFLNIIRVLWYKMQERGAIRRTDNRRQYKKLAKSTLVLIPMFGVHAIVFIGMPDRINEGIWWDMRMYFDLFFNSFQGFFVAIIYCFCNGEVQAEFKKAWDRFNLSKEMQKGRRERSRSSVTMLTSFNSSGSNAARLSIGGVNGRGSIKPNGYNHNTIPYTNGNGHTVETRLPLLNKQVSMTTDLDSNGATSTSEQCPGYPPRDSVEISNGDVTRCESTNETGFMDNKAAQENGCKQHAGEEMYKLIDMSGAGEGTEELEFEQALDKVENKADNDDHIEEDLFSVECQEITTKDILSNTTKTIPNESHVTTLSASVNNNNIYSSNKYYPNE